MRSGRGSSGHSVRSLATQRINPALPDGTSTAKGVGMLDPPGYPSHELVGQKCAAQVNLATP